MQVIIDRRQRLLNYSINPLYRIMQAEKSDAYDFISENCINPLYRIMQVDVYDEAYNAALQYQSLI